VTAAAAAAAAGWEGTEKGATTIVCWPDYCWYHHHPSNHCHNSSDSRHDIIHYYFCIWSLEFWQQHFRDC
jgi:hypothetical protein